MINSNTSYRNFTVGEIEPGGGERLPIGSALLAILGLSLLGWAVVIAPVVAILYN
jgi:hypothetical protein